MNWLRYLLVVVVVGFEVTSAARILAFMPLPWKSHHFVYHPLLKALAKRGHQIDFYTPLPMSNAPKNLNQIKITDVYRTYDHIIDMNEYKEGSPYKASTLTYELHRYIIAKIFEKDKVFSDLIQSNATYDLVILEAAFCMEPLSYLAHKFSAPFIHLAGGPDFPWYNELSGLPDNPSYVVSQMGYPTKTFFERLYNFYVTESIILSSYWETATTQQEVADKYMRYEGWQNRPKLTKMISDAALVLANEHISVSPPYPKSPHVKLVGGIHIDPEPLPKNLQAFMDDAPHGVIYFSLGTVLDPQEMLAGGKFDILLKVFRSLKQKVMWKVPPEMPEINDPNIKVQSWFPQQAILEHKNVVLFITHGGMQSMVEAINSGVPLIGTPGLFDQPKNVDVMVSFGMGLRLNFDNLTENTVSWTINEVLTNPSYKKAAKERQSLFKSRPMTAIEEGVYWTEYVLKYGKVLQPASVHMPFYQVYLLDIFAVLLLIACTVLWCIRKVACLFCSLVFQRKKPHTPPKKTRKVE